MLPMAEPPHRFKSSESGVYALHVRPIEAHSGYGFVHAVHEALAEVVEVSGHRILPNRAATPKNWGCIAPRLIVPCGPLR